MNIGKAYMELLKRPVFMMTLGSIIGIIIGVYFHQSIPFFAILILIWVICSVKIQMMKPLILFWVFFLIFSVRTYDLEKKYQEKYQVFDGNTIQVNGTIISDIEEKEYQYSFCVKIELINGRKGFQNDLILVYISKKNAIDSFRYGDLVSFTGEFSKGSVARNDKGFDYQFYLKTKEIYGIVSIKEGKIFKEKSNYLNVFKMLNYQTEKLLEKVIKKYLPTETANLEIGILLGYSKEIDSKIQQAFQDSSITHMLAVSGENTMYVILLINWIFQKKYFGNYGQKIISILVIWWCVV